MTSVDRGPTTINSLAAVGGAIAAIVAAGYGSVSGMGVAIGGFGLFVIGLLRGRFGVIDLGCVLLFGGVVLGAYESGSVEITLVGTIGAVLAWDLGQSATDLGSQVGRNVDTTRLELVQIGSSLLIGLVSIAIGYAVFVFASGNQPIGAVFLLLVAAVLLTVGLEVREHV